MFIFTRLAEEGKRGGQEGGTTTAPFYTPYTQAMSYINITKRRGKGWGTCLFNDVGGRLDVGL
jgi:hypothetical protein